MSMYTGSARKSAASTSPIRYRVSETKAAGRLELVTAVWTRQCGRGESQELQSPPPEPKRGKRVGC